MRNNLLSLIFFLPVLLISWAAAALAADSILELPVSKLPAGKQVFESGKVLVGQPPGFTRIANPAAKQSNCRLLWMPTAWVTTGQSPGLFVSTWDCQIVPNQAF
ncbi:MAG TPA: hypothetical protein EYO96_04680 [Candidatus Marinimicrobia bacterium]|nr:hypothetical protein [Candidatus Neomarinimicrobiota bacterium]